MAQISFSDFLVLPMKKMFIVSRNFPPLIGGMERLNFHIYKSLEKNFDVDVAGPNGSSRFLGCKNVVEFPFFPVWKYVVFSLVKTVFFSFNKRYEFVFCGSGSAILAGYFSARITSAKLVCYLHGLDVIADSKIYQLLFLPFIKKSDLLFVNSEYTKKLAIAAGMDVCKLKVINPGVDLPPVKISTTERSVFREQYGLTEKQILLVVGRLTKRKGVLEFIENVMPNLVAQHPHVVCVVIGGTPSGALSARDDVTDRVQSLVKKLDLSSHVMLMGEIADSLLTSAYFAADLMVFPVLDLPGDVEGFGMVAVESAAHGLPTMAFSVGGVSDAVSSGESGWLIPAGDYDLMGQKISTFLTEGHGRDELKVRCRNFAEQFSWDKFESKLMSHLSGK